MPTEYDASYTLRQSDRSRFRKWVRRMYLARAESLVAGPTLDFGCGIGELLSRLPPGSEGLEYNQATVEYCRRAGLKVSWYDGFADDWSLTALAPTAQFDSMVVSHVLEHFDGPLEIFIKLLRSVRRHGVRRVLAIVPGPAGYRIDSTHRTFVDLDLLSSPRIAAESGFSVVRSNYFPVDLKPIGNWFPHHELQVVYEILD